MSPVTLLNTNIGTTRPATPSQPVQEFAASIRPAGAAAVVPARSNYSLPRCITRRALMRLIAIIPTVSAPKRRP